MAVTRVFPKRQEDPLIQQLLERARQEAAQSSAIGSPSMYAAAAGGGAGPAFGVLTAQVLAGVRSGTAQREAQQRQEISNQAASMLRRAETTGQLGDGVIVNEMGNLLRMGTPTQIDRVNVTDTSSYQNVTPQDLTATQIPLEPTTIRLGPEDDPNFLERAFLGRTLKGQDISNIDQLKVAAGYDPLEYDYFKGQLSKSNTTIREFDGNLVSINNDTGEVATLKEGTNKSGVEKISDGIYKLYKDGSPLTRQDGSPVTAKGVTVKTKDGKLVTKINKNGVFVDGNLLGQGITYEPASKASVSKTNINIEDKSEAEEQKEEAKQRVKITLDSVYSNDANNPGLLQQAKKAQNGYNNLIESFNLINALPNTQGGLAEAKRIYLSFKTGLGIPVSQKEIDSLTNMQVLKSQFNSSTINILDSFKGTLSEKELQYANNVMSQLGNTPNANRIIVLLGMYNFDKVRKFNDIFREKSNKLRADGKLDELYTVKSSAEMIDDYDQYLSKRESPIEFIENLAEKEAEVLVNNMTNNNPQNLTPQQIDDKVAKMIQERYLLDKLSTFFSGYPR